MVTLNRKKNLNLIKSYPKQKKKLKAKMEKKELNQIQCKVSKDDHVVKDPICLPCGFSACRSCYEKSKFCFHCKMLHEMNTNEIKPHIGIQKKIENNIKKLIDYKMLEVEKYRNSIIGRLKIY